MRSRTGANREVGLGAQSRSDHRLAGLGRPIVLTAVAGAIATLLVTVVSVSPVHASCEPREDPVVELGESDAAFVGSLLSRPPDDTQGNQTIWSFEVERWVKGEGGETVDVRAPFNTSVDFEFGPGGRIGVLLYLSSDGIAESSGCSVVDPDVLLAAAAPRPDPDGTGPLAMIVGGDFGSDRIVALDEDGGVLGYGPGVGTVSHMSVCPGSRVSVEYSSDPLTGLAVIARRDLSTLEVLGEVSLDSRYGGFVSGLLCTSGDGTAALAVARSESPPDYPAVPVPGKVPERVLSGVIISPFPEPQVVAEGPWPPWYVTMAGTVAITHSHGQLLAVDVESGRPTVLVDIYSEEGLTGENGLADFHSAVISPDGSRVAVTYWVQTDDVWFHRLRVIDIATARVSAELTMTPHHGEDTALWIDDSRIAVVSFGGDPQDTVTGTVRVLDSATLGIEHEFSGFDHRPIGVIDDAIYAFAGADKRGGRLVAVAITGGPISEVRVFPTPDTVSLTEVRDGGPVTPAPTSADGAPTTTTPPASIPPGRPIEGETDEAAESAISDTGDTVPPITDTVDHHDESASPAVEGTDDAAGGSGANPAALWIVGGFLVGAGLLVTGRSALRRG